MGTHHSPPFQRRMLGKQLRDLREAAGITALAAAQRAEISTGRLSRIENGEVAPDIPLAKYLLDLYVIPVNDWEPYLELVRAAKRAKGWWQAYGVEPRGYTALETAANSVRSFELAHMPGLLRTEDHTREGFRALHSDPRVIDNQVRVRMIRQERLYSSDDQLVLHAIVDQAVLTRQVGCRDVMRAQLRHLVEVAQLGNVTLQVVPAERGTYVGMDGAFSVLSFPVGPELAYIDHPAGSLQIEKPDQVRTCRVAFERIASDALDPADSAALIRRVEQTL